ncbi:MAG: rhomboid family intramembrane serine protease [Thermofilaceae archaeon]|nr:rhomboid family intramembrane serine protease [Thermofilaceae archaeon]MCX8180787.1 rhomboid family intramembrane serine protease [Thermofilaceae archaeon]MDW8004817.1 rhomboid family intramembrane serine protease [Thermofilaceae archaeon]
MFPLNDEVRRKSTPLVTYILVASNVGAFVYSLVKGLEHTLLSFGFRPVYLWDFYKLETLFTSLFLHGDVVHIAGNLVYLFVFGRSVEDRVGHLAYFTLYLLSGLAGTLLHCTSIFLMPLDILMREMERPLVGASGAISGIIGAYVVFFPESRVLTLIIYIYMIFIKIPVRYYVLAWFLYQLLIGTLSLGYPLTVAAWAHIGGFAAGSLSALIVKHFIKGL